MITVIAGDSNFQKTLTDREKEYIHQGCNWISKLGRETELKSIHLIGYTLDMIEALPEEERKRVVNEADVAWSKHVEEDHVEAAMKFV